MSVQQPANLQAGMNHIHALISTSLSQNKQERLQGKFPYIIFRKL